MVKGTDTELFEKSFNKIFDGLCDVTPHLSGWHYDYTWEENGEVESIAIEFTDDEPPNHRERIAHVYGDSPAAAIYDVITQAWWKEI